MSLFKRSIKALWILSRSGNPFIMCGFWLALVLIPNPAQWPTQYNDFFKFLTPTEWAGVLSISIAFSWAALLTNHANWWKYSNLAMAVIWGVFAIKFWGDAPTAVTTYGLLSWSAIVSAFGLGSGFRRVKFEKT